MNHEEAKEALFTLCQKFINKHHIGFPETIYQTDYVIENAYEFIEDICDIVGYMKFEDDE